MLVYFAIIYIFISSFVMLIVAYDDYKNEEDIKEKRIYGILTIAFLIFFLISWTIGIFELLKFFNV